MTEIEVIPASLDVGIEYYFRTVTDDTVLYTMGVAPCIAGLFYRQGHLGLGHFNPSMDAVIDDTSRVVQPRMQEHGSGDIGCSLYTGQNFMVRQEYPGEPGIAKYFGEIDQIEALGFEFDHDNSRTYILANQHLALIIGRLKAQLVGEDLERVAVKIEYMGRDGSGGVERSLEEFEIDTLTNETRIIQPFTGHIFPLE